MPRFISLIIGVLFALHGLVHLLYVAQSRRWLELQPGMDWPAGSWAFSRLLGDDMTRWLASIAFAIVAVGLVFGAISLLVGLEGSWRPIVAASAAFSASMILLLWNGAPQRLDDQGLFGLLIDLAILAGLLIWPSL